MRVLHVYKDYPPVPGGIENHVRTLAVSQARRGHEVTVVAAAPGGRTAVEERDGVRVVLAGRWATIASTPISPAMASCLGRLRPDIAHLHVPYPFGEAVYQLFCRAAGTVVTYHSDVVRQRWLRVAFTPMLRRLLGRADRIIVTSAAYAGSSLHVRPFREKCRIVPIGVDLERFRPRGGSEISALRRALGLPVGRLVALFVGRLRYYKGLTDLIRAMPAATGPHLAIVGDGPRRAECRHVIGELGLAERVTMAGHVVDDDVPRWYRAADLFILPSNARAEAFGTVIVEAMASGLPVISTEIGTATSWVNVHGETGLVVPPGDSAALAAAINLLASKTPLREAYGRNARRRAEDFFGADAMIAAVESVYEEVLQSATRRRAALQGRGDRRGLKPPARQRG